MNRPSLKLGPHLTPGIAAVALFAVMAWLSLNAGFDLSPAFPEGESVVEAIGYSLIDVTDSGIPSEGFLAALIIIALALDGALDGAIHLAQREEVDDSGGDRE